MDDSLNNSVISIKELRGRVGNKVVDNILEEISLEVGAKIFLDYMQQIGVIVPIEGEIKDPMNICIINEYFEERGYGQSEKYKEYEVDWIVC